MPSQDDIIGEHPEDPNIFNKWFTATDHPPKADICHRALTGRVDADDPEVIEWLARKIIEHHYSPALISRLKSRYKTLGFPKFAEMHNQLPESDTTRKGNATEIILIEYLENCLDNEQIKAFRLRYNPNVDQAMKGDDALLVEVIEDDRGNNDLKVILGEAKFRGTPSSAVLDEIKGALGKDKVPLSYSFLIQRLAENEDTEELADLLENFLIEEIKAKGNLRYAGLLLSTTAAGGFVERHFKMDNPAMVIISAGIDQPGQLITNAFEKALEILEDPDLL
jgi:hypothetical protein